MIMITTFAYSVRNVRKILSASTVAFAKNVNQITIANTKSVLRATNGTSIFVQTAATASSQTSFASTVAGARVVLIAITANTAIVLTTVRSMMATTLFANNAATASKTLTAVNTANCATIAA